MKSREDVIKGLECCAVTPSGGICPDDCPYMDLRNHGECCSDILFPDVLALVKEHIPRVLTYDEARNHAMQFMNPDSIKPLFIEFRIKDDEDEEAMRPPWRGGYNQRLMLMDQKDRYGVDFRFWTDRPTKEQMEATSWETKAEKP